MYRDFFFLNSIGLFSERLATNSYSLILDPDVAEMQFIQLYPTPIRHLWLDVSQASLLQHVQNGILELPPLNEPVPSQYPVYKYLVSPSTHLLQQKFRSHPSLLHLPPPMHLNSSQVQFSILNISLSPSKLSFT